MVCWAALGGVMLLGWEMYNSLTALRYGQEVLDHACEAQDQAIKRLLRRVHELETKAHD